MGRRRGRQGRRVGRRRGRERRRIGRRSGRQWRRSRRGRRQQRPCIHLRLERRRWRALVDGWPGHLALVPAVVGLLIDALGHVFFVGVAHVVAVALGCVRCRWGAGRAHDGRAPLRPDVGVSQHERLVEAACRLSESKSHHRRKSRQQLQMNLRPLPQHEHKGRERVRSFSRRACPAHIAAAPALPRPSPFLPSYLSSCLSLSMSVCVTD
jgi:hypothetical protein